MVRLWKWACVMIQASAAFARSLLAHSFTCHQVRLETLAPKFRILSRRKTSQYKESKGWKSSGSGSLQTRRSGRLGGFSWHGTLAFGAYCWCCWWFAYYLPHCSARDLRHSSCAFASGRAASVAALAKSVLCWHCSSIRSLTGPKEWQAKMTTQIAKWGRIVSSFFLPVLVVSRYSFASLWWQWCMPSMASPGLPLCCGSLCCWGWHSSSPRGGPRKFWTHTVLSLLGFLDTRTRSRKRPLLISGTAPLGSKATFYHVSLVWARGLASANQLGMHWREQVVEGIWVPLWCFCRKAQDTLAFTAPSQKLRTCQVPAGARLCMANKSHGGADGGRTGSKI